MPYFKCNWCHTAYPTTTVVLKNQKFGITLEEAVKNDNWKYPNRRGKGATFIKPGSTKDCCKLESMEWQSENMPEKVEIVKLPDLAPVEFKTEPMLSLASLPSMGINMNKMEASPAPLNHKPTFNPTGVRPTSPLLQYGANQCLYCNAKEGHAISESNQTRAIATFVYGLLASANVPKDPPFMIGVATVADMCYIVTSKNVNQPKQLEDILGGVTIVGYKVRTTNQYPRKEKMETLGGQDVSEIFDERSRTLKGDEDVRDTRACAATRLISNYITKQNRSKASMTELAYGVISSRYTDGEAAISCMGCMVVLPMLLCTA